MNNYFQFNRKSRAARLYIKVKANAKSNSIDEPIEIDGQEYLKIKIKAPPIEGKANETVVAFLSEEYGVKKSDITIKRGHSSNLKELEFLRLPN